MSNGKQNAKPVNFWLYCRTCRLATLIANNRFCSFSLSDWDFLFDRYLSTDNADERRTILEALACSTDPATLKEQVLFAKSHAFKLVTRTKKLPICLFLSLLPGTWTWSCPRRTASVARTPSTSSAPCRTTSRWGSRWPGSGCRTSGNGYTYWKCSYGTGFFLGQSSTSFLCDMKCCQVVVPKITKFFVKKPWFLCFFLLRQSGVACRHDE